MKQLRLPVIILVLLFVNGFWDSAAAIRANRLALLARIRAATGQVADFSRIAG